MAIDVATYPPSEASAGGGSMRGASRRRINCLQFRPQRNLVSLHILEIFRIARCSVSVVQLRCSSERRVRSPGAGILDCPRGKGKNPPQLRLGSVGAKPRKLNSEDARRGHCSPCSFASFDVSSEVHPRHLLRCIGGGVCVLPQLFRCLV